MDLLPLVLPPDKSVFWIAPVRHRVRSRLLFARVVPVPKKDLHQDLTAAKAVCTSAVKYALG
jgi:hypothetical protein